MHPQLFDIAEASELDVGAYEAMEEVGLDVAAQVDLFVVASEAFDQALRAQGSEALGALQELQAGRIGFDEFEAAVAAQGAVVELEVHAYEAWATIAKDTLMVDL